MTTIVYNDGKEDRVREEVELKDIGNRILLKGKKEPIVDNIMDNHSWEILTSKSKESYITDYHKEKRDVI